MSFQVKSLVAMAGIVGALMSRSATLNGQSVEVLSVKGKGRVALEPIEFTATIKQGEIAQVITGTYALPLKGQEVGTEMVTVDGKTQKEGHVGLSGNLLKRRAQLRFRWKDAGTGKDFEMLITFKMGLGSVLKIFS